METDSLTYSSKYLVLLYLKDISLKLTIVIIKGEEFYIGTIKEIPEVVTQGATVEEAKSNVIDALQLYLEDMQSEDTKAENILEEDLIISACL